MNKTILLGEVCFFAGAVLIIAFPIGKGVPAGNFSIVAAGATLCALPFILILSEILQGLKNIEQTLNGKQTEKEK